MKTFGKAVIGTMLAGAALNGTANAHDGNHERTIYSTKVKGKCEQALSQSAPAPQVVIYPTTTYVPPVTTMVPTTRYETITENVCTPVTRVVPTTTYAPSTNTGYYSSTPTHTTSSYTTSDGPCNNADT